MSEINRQHNPGEVGHLSRNYPAAQEHKPTSDALVPSSGQDQLSESSACNVGQQRQLAEPEQASSTASAVPTPTGQLYVQHNQDGISSNLEPGRRGQHNSSSNQLASGDLSPRRAGQDRVSRDAPPNDGGSQLDNLASLHHPPASLPSFGQGYSLPQGVTQPPLQVGPSSLSSVHEADSRGGYEADFVIQLNDKHKCPICLLALREPVQTDCGHRFCHSCIDPIRKQRQPLCPLDKEPLQMIFPDNFCKREVLALLVRCMNNVAGCGWTGQLRELKDHGDSCPFTVVLCLHWGRGCRVRVMQAKLQYHVEFECEYRDSLCTHCQSTLPLKELEMHIRDMCPDVELPCINECGIMVKRKEMPNHISIVCDKTVLECDFFKVGCQFKGPRPTLKAHMESSKDHHLTLAVQQSSSLEKQVSKLNDKLDKKENTVTCLSEQCERFESWFSEMVSKIMVLERTSERHSQLEDRLNTMEGLVSGVATAQPTGAVSSNTLSALTKKVDEAVGMAAQAEAGASVTQQKVVSLESKVSGLDRQMVHLNTIIGRTDAILAEFDLRLLSQETTSFGGVLVWKIPDFNRHYEEARTAKKPSLCSPPFYTSRHGYRLCARVYLYGDGVGKSTHMSVFFVVMRGEFDALLSWPFHQKVTLTLLDQSPAKRHISDTFMPDPSSSSFQRPSSEMNIASGCPRFVSLDTLRTAHGYVKENTIFLRVAVDCTGLPAY